MPNDNGFSVYPDDGLRRDIEQYQTEHNLNKSQAASRLMKIGLQEANGGLLAGLYREIGKMCLVIGVAVAALSSGGASLELPLMYYAFMFVGAGLVALVFDAYDVSVMAWLGAGEDDTGAAESPR